MESLGHNELELPRKKIIYLYLNTDMTSYKYVSLAINHTYGDQSKYLYKSWTTRNKIKSPNFLLAQLSMLGQWRDHDILI